MPRLTDKNEIRTCLRRDPAWSVYALGDLAPPMFPKTLWFAPDLALMVQDCGAAILFAMGPGSVREALECVAGPVHLQVQRDALDEVARHAAVSSPRLMWRMAWSGSRLAWPGAVNTRLGASDVPALLALYADGVSSGESPDFFFPSMVADGVFHGIYEGTALVAAAGTHLLAREEGAAAIGNVYTRHDRRRRGLGRLATSAVLGELAGVETMASTSAPTTTRRCISTSRSASRVTASFTRRWRRPEIIATHSEDATRRGFGSTTRSPYQEAHFQAPQSLPGANPNTEPADNGLESERPFLSVLAVVGPAGIRSIGCSGRWRSRRPFRPRARTGSGSRPRCARRRPPRLGDRSCGRCASSRPGWRSRRR